MILAIETATDICSVGFKNEAGEIFEKRSESRGSHSEKLFLFIEELMNEQQFSTNDLSAVLVSEGPGSYTGLRIAASGVKGLLFGTDVPLYSVSTLASFAYGIHDRAQNGVHAIIDARRVHVYHQSFYLSNNEIKADGDVEVVPITSFEEMVQPGDIIIGTGINRLDEELVDRIQHYGKDFISACALINLYESSSSEDFTHRVQAKQFDPKYYTSSQVNNLVG